MFNKTIVRSIATFIAVTVIGCGGGAAKEDRGFYTSGSKEADQRADQIMAKDAQLKGGAADGTSLGNKLGNRELTGPNGVPVADEKRTLYDRLGGEEGVRAIVDDVVDRALADPQVNLERKGVKRGGLGLDRGQSMEWQATGQKLDAFKMYLMQFVSLKSGGPTVYNGGDLATVSKDLHVSNAEFDAAVGDMKATLDKLKIPNQEQKELLAILESTRTQIVEER